jgi:hypothetical protein
VAQREASSYILFVAAVPCHPTWYTTKGYEYGSCGRSCILSKRQPHASAMSYDWLWRLLSAASRHYCRDRSSDREMAVRSDTDSPSLKYGQKDWTCRMRWSVRVLYLEAASDTSTQVALYRCESHDSGGGEEKNSKWSKRRDKIYGVVPQCCGCCSYVCRSSILPPHWTSEAITFRASLLSHFNVLT